MKHSKEMCYNKQSIDLQLCSLEFAMDSENAWKTSLNRFKFQSIVFMLPNVYSAVSIVLYLRNLHHFSSCACPKKGAILREGITLIPLYLIYRDFQTGVHQEVNRISSRELVFSDSPFRYYLNVFHYIFFKTEIYSWVTCLLANLLSYLLTALGF